MIACASPELGIGANNDLLGHVPEDMSFFREKTKYESILMGSKTAKSLPHGLPLKDRTNYVLCRKEEADFFLTRGFRVLHADNPVDCLSEIHTDKLIVIGGGFMYQEFISVADVIYLNIYYDFNIVPDTFFPEVKLSEWSLVSIRESSCGSLTYKKYERRCKKPL